MLSVPLWRAWLALSIVFAGLVAAVQAYPYEDTVRPLLYAVPCPQPDEAPCPFGLQPGVTTGFMVNRFLLTDPAVWDHYPNLEGLTNRTGQIDWEWRTPPDHILPVTGRLGLYGSRLTYVTVVIDLSLGDVAAAFSAIPALSVSRFNPGVVTAAFFDGALNVSAEAGCPLTPESVWHTRPLVFQRSERVRVSANSSADRASEARDTIWSLC
jgi:hypothetical protein